jgi:hypothetical protein
MRTTKHTHKKNIGSSEIQNIGFPGKTLAMSKMLPQEPKGDCWQHLPPLQQYQQIHSYGIHSISFQQDSLSLSVSHIRSLSYWLSSAALHHPNQAGAVAKFSNQTT